MSVIENLTRVALADVDLLRKNDASGDDFAKPRAVDFLIVAGDGERAALFRDFVSEHEYGEASVEAVDGEHRILVRVQMPTTQHVLMSVSGFMQCLASLFGARYDGWGCVLQRRAPGSASG